MTRRLVKNAVANLARGSAAAVVALLLPPVLVRYMPSASYAVWVLALQAAAYVTYLDLGLQTAVARYIAFANEKKDMALRDGVFSTALAGLSIAGVLGFLIVVVIAIASYKIFPSVPSELVVPLRTTMLIVGAGTALALPGSAWSGIFVGLQRYEVPALANGSGKFLLAAGLIWAAMTGKSLAVMSFILVATTLYIYAVQFFAKRWIAPEIHFQKALIVKPVIKELLSYCFSLGVWSFSMLLINGLDLILVGRFQFAAVTSYSVSSTLITFLIGIQVAIFGVIMPHAAELYAQKNSGALGKLATNTTQLGVLLLLITGLPLIVFSSLIIKVWIGPQFAVAGGEILTILVIANMTRLTGTPYASILQGTGQQKQVIVAPLAESLTNLLASVALGVKFGAIGVALGTLIGALVGVFATIFYSLPRTRDSIEIAKRKYLSSLVLPALCGLPVYLALLAKMFHPVSDKITFLALLASWACCLCFFIRVRGMKRKDGGLPTEDYTERRIGIDARP